MAADGKVVVVQVDVADDLQLHRAQPVVVVAVDHRWDFRKKSAVADPLMVVAVVGNHRYSAVVGAGRRGVVGSVDGRLGADDGNQRLVTNQNHSVDDAVAGCFGWGENLGEEEDLVAVPLPGIGEA